ncbi:MAG: hypothetical protein M3N19_00500 [Candidatus Eremiobacteraeota bacterium]|nr:hypothetical protein [Candidatus Eremiobacteraeota bacterium]
MRTREWTSDDLLFLEAAFISGMTLEGTAAMLRKERQEVEVKAREFGFIQSPPIAPHDDAEK